MGLSSRWDRYAAAFFVLVSVALMTGCLALPSSTASNSNGSVSAGTTSLDFGTAVVGASKQLTDTLANNSSATVTIASAMSSDASFQVVAPVMPFNLAPGQSAALTVSFTPRAAGKPAGRLTISTSAATAGTIAVTLAGSAVSAGALELSPASLSFGTVAVGQSEAKTATLKNSGGSAVTVSKASVSSAAFTLNGLTLPVTLAASQSTNFTVTFAPKSSGSASGSIAVTGSASLSMSAASGSSGPSSTSTTASLPLAGSGTSAGQLTVSPTTVAFGNVTVGSPQNQAVTLTNSGGTSATISQASATGPGVSISGLALPLVLAAGQSSTFQVTFAPTVAGTVTGSLAIVSTATNPNLAVAVTGTAVTPGTIAFTPPSVSFGNVQVGTSQNQPATITNSGGASMTITRATAAGAGFSVTGLTLPLTLGPGQSSAFSVTFAPQASGNVSGSVAFTSNSATATLSLSGAGLAVGSLSPNPASVNFGSIQLGSNQAQAITLTNSGSSSVTITQASASGTGFSMTGPTLPATLNSGQSASFTATFAP
ncbi:MAG: choice-of-anchor D domain-containing protein, partial [Terriglobales bacterium]